MAKLRDLVAITASALGDPPAAVGVLAAELRKARLIRTSGRGLNAADMTAEDAANLLIASLAEGLATEAASRTALVREANLIASGWSEKSWTHGVPPVRGLEQLAEFHTFADMLIAILKTYGEHGPVEAGGDASVRIRVEIAREVSRYTAKVEFDFEDGRRWTSHYSARRPEFTDHPPASWPEFAQEIFKKEGGRKVTSSVGDYVLGKVAAAVRGEGA